MLVASGSMHGVASGRILIILSAIALVGCWRTMVKVMIMILVVVAVVLLGAGAIELWNASYA